MATRGALSVVARAGIFVEACASERTSKPSIALLQTSGFVLTRTYGISPLVRLTFAPAFSNRLTTIAEVAPLYGKRHALVPLLITGNTGFGVAATFCRTSVPGSALLANSVLTPNCIPRDHAETS